MSQQESKFTEKESLALITSMINKAKDSYHDTGVGAMMWGCVVAVCSLVRLAEIHYDFRLPFDIYLLTLAAIIPQVFITIKEKKARKATATAFDDVYMDYIWLGFGIGLGLLIHVVNISYNDWSVMANEYKDLTGKSPSFKMYEYIYPLFLILYGLPTFITGAACKFKPMLWGGLLCWACSIAAVYTSIRIDLLLTALSAIAAWFIPGLIMEREYRRYKKEQVASHV